jgi:hypothetical protein
MFTGTNATALELALTVVPVVDEFDPAPKKKPGSANKPNCRLIS